MSKMKKFISVSIIAALVIGSTFPVYASESYGLTSLMNKAMDSNVDMKLLKIQTDREKADYIAARAIGISLVDDVDEDDAQTYTDKQNIDLTPIKEKKVYLDKAYEKLQKENDLEYQVKNLFYTYFNMLEDTRSKQEYYTFMEDKKEAEVIKLEVGQITQLQYDTFLQSYDQAFLGYLKSKNALDAKVREINIYIDQEPSAQLDLINAPKTPIDLSKVDLTSIEALIIENSYQLDTMELDLEINTVDKQLKSRFKGFAEKAIELEILDDKILELESKISDKERSLKGDLYTKYNEAIIAEKEIEVKQLSYDLAKRTFDIDQLKFENGLISLIDLSESRKNFEDSYYAINTAKLSQYLTVQSFLDFVEENTTKITIE